MPDAEAMQTVLLVDDNESILKSLMPEFNVLCACSGKEALAILTEKEADIIITDVMMPDIWRAALQGRQAESQNIAYLGNNAIGQK